MTGDAYVLAISAQMQVVQEAELSVGEGGSVLLSFDTATMSTVSTIPLRSKDIVVTAGGGTMECSSHESSYLTWRRMRKASNIS